MRVLVTGAARAIGAATVNELTARGHHVIATARDSSLLADVDAAARLSLDVTSDASVDAALGQAGELDAIVNNAGVTASGPLEVFPIEQVRAVLETNTIGPLRLIQKVVPAWRQRGSGVIVNVSSVQGRVATPVEGVYSASKYALEALSEALHYELSHFGIRTVIIEPGYIAPGMKSAPSFEGPPIYAELWEQWNGTDTKVTGPAGRSGPELVGAAIADAIENADTPLRVPVGPDAEMVLATRQRLDDAAFESTMRAALDLTW
jgi:NAD(P)-dependent dehydrogenase (short-subunit alcohol dehydrogenase family)